MTSTIGVNYGDSIIANPALKTENKGETHGRTQQQSMNIGPKRLPGDPPGPAGAAPGPEAGLARV